MKHLLLLCCSVFILFSACKKDEDKDNNGETKKEPKLIFKVKIDGQQERLDNLGQPAEIPQGNAAQTPDFNTISAHYIELSQSAFVQVGDGEVLYHAPETQVGGGLAIDFSKSVIVKDGEVMFEVPLKDVSPGAYEYARVSIVYQNYSVDFRASGMDFKGTIASFVGYNTYITSHVVNQLTDVVSGNRLQGYWAWETHPNQFLPEPQLQTGQTAGTTVPNPIAGTSPIPPGSCLVTGQIEDKLVISGSETEDVVVELSFSVNNSFEWEDLNGNGLFEPLDDETVVDMGLRGLIARKLP
jgi:hypothetical protein